MIETLGTLTESIIRDLSGGDIPSDSPYKPEFVVRHICDAMREDLKMEILNRRGGMGGKEDDRTAVTQYIATLGPITVKQDSATARTYIDLPAYMSLKFNKGIHAISTEKGSLKRFIPIANPGVTSRLPHGDLERDNFGYYLEGLRAFFMRDLIREKITKLLLKVVQPAPESLGMDDPLPILPENVGRIKEMVKARMVNRIPNDRLNDNNPNLRVTNA
ncbi:MAG: hypothetical protein QM762_12745 [Chryseolinea sp.]